MNKVEKYFSRCVEDIKEQYKDNPKGLYSKVIQLGCQANGIVRDCFITNFRKYAFEQELKGG